MKCLLEVLGIMPLSIFASDIHYVYNTRSELTRVMRGDEVLYGYEYDLAGNLKWSCAGCSTNVYAVNCLNQYTTVTDSDGNVHQLTYDEDGNLVMDFRRIYTWDSASRMEISRPLPGEGGFAIRNYYDALSRRVKKETWFVAPLGTYPPERPISTTTYVYDGVLPILEVIEEVGGTVRRTEYNWGKDLSGTLEGAGGVGGLVSVKIDDAVYVPQYDVGGNIISYTDSSGAVVARRIYSAFGQMISGHGMPAIYARLHIWFSTKYCDRETGLYYFGGRFYSPFLCRWLNRDPIGEQGGLNLYAFCRNDPINHYDKNGCAYFVKRRLDYFPWVRGLSENADLDIENRELVHEHLIFEDDGPTSGAGYFGDGKVHENDHWQKVKWVRVPGHYNDCVMRKAVDSVKPKPYTLIGSNQYNCQDYADDLRAKYRELIRDKKIRCECRLDKK